MNKLKLILALFLLVNFTNCTSDLRTKITKSNTNETKAKALIIEMGKAHNIEAWKNIRTYNVDFEEEFFGRIGKSGNPYPDMKTELLLSYIPNSFDGQFHFKSGQNKDTGWGLQSWKTYNIIGKKNTFEENKDALFWIPTYQYFMEFPLRIQKATAFGYAGTKEINDINCEGVIVSWNTIEPQRKIDQYLIWLHPETKQIVKLEYTIREISKLIKGAVYYQDYKNYDGIILPSKLPVESNLVKNGWLHEMRIKDFTKNIVTINSLRPNKDLSVLGDSKD
ncbi:MAG: hypothetical protein AB8G11_25455 [Saprospiraceae bacterium]